jgi:hypothetical protein
VYLGVRRSVCFGCSSSGDTLTAPGGRLRLQRPGVWIDLAKYDGYVVDIRGTVKDDGVADLYALTVDRIRRLHRYDG